MIIFLLIVLIFTILISLAIIFYIKKSSVTFSVSEVNKNIFKHQFNEINKDFQDGIINEKEFDTMKNELSKRVLKYSITQDFQEESSNKNLTKIITILCVPLMVLFSFLFYYYNGQPGLPDLPLSERNEINVPSIFYERAIKDIDNRISLTDDNIELYILKANTLVAIDNLEEAINTWKYIINNFNDKLNAAIYLSYGETIIQNTIKEEEQLFVTKEAKVVFEKAAKLSNIETEVGALTRFYIGLYDYQEGNKELAKKVWQEIIISAPENAFWKNQIESQVNQIFKNEFDIENARIKEMVAGLSERLYTSNSSNIAEWNRLGRSYIVLGQFGEAVKAYEKAYALDEKNLDSLKGLAESMLLNSQKDKPVDEKIINLFNAILLKDENYLLGLWVKADNEILLNNFDEAKKLLNRILIQLSEGTEEYNLVTRKLNELNK
jgi:cytochrome c-type biogenesis protein CcmH